MSYKLFLQETLSYVLIQAHIAALIKTIHGHDQVNNPLLRNRGLYLNDEGYDDTASALWIYYYSPEQPHPGEYDIIFADDEYPHKDSLLPNFHRSYVFVRDFDALDYDLGELTSQLELLSYVVRNMVHIKSYSSS